MRLGFLLPIFAICLAARAQCDTNVLGTAPGLAIDTALAGNLAYVVGEGAGLQIYDVSDPSSMALIGTAPFEETAFGVDVANGVAYVAAWNDGLMLIDVSDPAAPVVVDVTYVPSRVTDVAVIGNTLYAALGSTLQVYDVSAPLSPQLVLAVPSVHAWRLQLDGAQLVASGTTDYVYVADITDPFVPVLQLVSYPGCGGGDYIDSISASEGDRLYTVESGYCVTSKLFVHDTSGPGEPVLLGQADFWTGIARLNGLDVEDGVVAVNVLDTDNQDPDPRLVTFDVSDPTSPEVSGVFAIPGYPPSLTISEGKAYVSAYTGGLRVIDLAECAPCTRADLAPPFGILNFSDVLAFLGAFADEDPVADFATPVAWVNFSDVVAFLADFADGCP